VALLFAIILGQIIALSAVMVSFFAIICDITFYYRLRKMTALFTIMVAFLTGTIQVFLRGIPLFLSLRRLRAKYTHCRGLNARGTCSAPTEAERRAKSRHRDLFRHMAVCS